MNHIWDVINSGGIYNFWDGGDVVNDFGYCTWNDSKFDDNVIDEYWDENESNEEAIDQNWDGDDDDDNFDEFGFLSLNKFDNDAEIIDQYWRDVDYEDIGT